MKWFVEEEVGCWWFGLYVFGVDGGGREGEREMRDKMGLYYVVEEKKASKEKSQRRENLSGDS